MKTCITCILAAIFSVAVSHADGPRPKPELYDLEVSFLTPYNHDFTVLTTIQVAQPFEMVATNGQVRNTVSGTLQPPKGGKYPIDLMISEWQWEKSNTKGTTRLELELGKGSGYVSAGGVVSMWYVMLRRHESRIIPK